MAMGMQKREAVFDFKKLCDTFTEICPDFAQGPGPKKSQSLDFANQVLFSLGPKLRNCKQRGRDQMWRLILWSGGSVYVYTYSFQKPITGQPRLGGGRLYLTVKQAGLLAASKFCSMLPTQLNRWDIILLTPLARAVFAPANIQKIARELSAHLGRTVNAAEVLRAVISSCQSDGFHLEASQCHIAMVAIGTTTREFSERQKLRKQTLKQYKKHGKAFDREQYKIYARHSKMAAPIINEQPIAIPDPPKKTLQHSHAVVLSSIAKSSDDQLSGGTVDLKFAAQPNLERRAQVEGMPESTEVRLVGTSMDDIRSKMLGSAKNT